MKEVDVTFVTGNIKKKEYLEVLLGLKIKNEKLELDEIQTLDMRELVEHKVKQAYSILKRPVLVEDVGLKFTEMKELPGVFVKFFLQQLTMQQMCDLIKGEDRSATAMCKFAYFDGERLEIFEGSLKGTIALKAAEVGEHGYGWDQIFIPEGFDKCRSQLSKEEDHATYMKVKPIEKVKDFLLTL